MYFCGFAGLFLWSRPLSWGWIVYEDHIHMPEPLTGMTMGTKHGWLMSLFMSLILQKCSPTRSGMKQKESRQRKSQHEHSLKTSTCVMFANDH